MMTTLMAEAAILAQDQIGEAPVWDPGSQTLIWLDHGRRIIHQAQVSSQGLWHETQRWSFEQPITYALPRTAGGFAIAAGNEIVLWDPTGLRSVFARVDIDPAHERIGDMKCDSRGRLWAGSFAPALDRAGALHCIERDGSVKRVLEGIELANGLDFSPDESVFYFADSLGFSVDAFDFDQQHGTLARRRRFVTIDPRDGAPNGITVDDDGCVWVAVTCAGEVRRYSPEGVLLGRFTSAIPGLTSCCFGGQDRRTLFITSRSGRVPELIHTRGVPEERLESRGVYAGALFMCRPGPSGSPARAFQE